MHCKKKYAAGYGVGLTGGNSTNPIRLQCVPRTDFSMAVTLGRERSGETSNSGRNLGVKKTMLKELGNLTRQHQKKQDRLSMPVAQK